MLSAGVTTVNIPLVYTLLGCTSICSAFSA